MNNGERKLCEWQYRMSGGFYRSLWESIGRADRFNLQKLEKGFPEEVEAYKRFTRENGYWDKLENEFLKQIEIAKAGNK